MKKLYSVIAATSLALAITGCSNNQVTTPTYDNLDERKLCNVSTNGIDSVLKVAQKYNKIAKEHGVEFKRLGMTNTQYIDESIKSINAGEKKVVLLNKKGKPTKNSVSVSYAVERACKFAVSALTQEAEGKKTWRVAVPGDQFQY